MLLLLYSLPTLVYGSTHVLLKLLLVPNLLQSPCKYYQCQTGSTPLMLPVMSLEAWRGGHRGVRFHVFRTSA